MFSTNGSSRRVRSAFYASERVVAGLREKAFGFQAFGVHVARRKDFAWAAQAGESPNYIKKFNIARNATQRKCETPGCEPGSRATSLRLRAATLQSWATGLRLASRKACLGCATRVVAQTFVKFFNTVRNAIREARNAKARNAVRMARL